jgi:mono/diheme cytochrome c family protein
MPATPISTFQHQAGHPPFHGDVTATGVEPAPPAPTHSVTAGRELGAPEGAHPEAERFETGAMPAPPGASAAQVALGARIFHGQAAGGTCAGCHGSNGKGSPLAPDLTTGKWLWSDGSLSGITRTIAEGVSQPKEYRNPMPPRGGAQLSEGDVSAVAAYVWALGHSKDH